MHPRPVFDPHASGLPRRARSFLMFVAIVACSGAFVACGGAGGGGGYTAGLPCAKDGTCPAGKQCVNNYCVTPQDTSTSSGGTSSGGTSSGGTSSGGTSSGADAGSSSGATSSGGTTSGGTSSGGTSSGATSSGGTSSGADAGSSSGATSSGGTTSGGTSSGGTSSGADAGSSSGATSSGGTSSGGPVKVAELQKGAASKVCASKKGETKVLTGVTFEDLVATQTPFKVGKNSLFHARPKGAPTVGGDWQGVKVFVLGTPPALTAGDVVEIKGDAVEYYCETEIKAKAADIKTVSKNSPPAPYEVVTKSITFDGEASEAFEGVLVKLINVKVTQPNTLGTDGKTHGGFSVASQTDLKSQVHVDLASVSQYTQKSTQTGDLVTTFTTGQVFSSVIGHLNYSFGEYVLIPRGDTDLVVQ